MTILTAAACGIVGGATLCILIAGVAYGIDAWRNRAPRKQWTVHHADGTSETVTW